MKTSLLYFIHRLVGAVKSSQPNPLPQPEYEQYFVAVIGKSIFYIVRFPFAGSLNLFLKISSKRVMSIENV